MQLPEKFYASRRLETLVEQRTTFAAAQAELHIYETHQAAEQVSLSFRDPVLTSMIQGKKIMYLPGVPPFEYLPGASVLTPAQQEMKIDFPEASPQSPTRCLALAIDTQKVTEVLQHQSHSELLSNADAKPSAANVHLLNDRRIHGLLQRMIGIFVEGNRAKDVFVDLTLKELLIRLLQSHARQFLLGNTPRQETRMSAVVGFVRQHLDRELSVADLARVACMSESHFYKCFKDTFGLTPTQLVMQERIRQAKTLLHQTSLSITQVSLECGFRHQNYFNKCFKEHTGLTPSAFKKQEKKLRQPY
ncbi:MAG: AraC family transcriptional regulator N-terminal domain-containing protein [Bernardetiaceae bacterium]